MIELKKSFYQKKTFFAGNDRTKKSINQKNHSPQTLIKPKNIQPQNQSLRTMIEQTKNFKPEIHSSRTMIESKKSNNQ